MKDPKMSTYYVSSGSQVANRKIPVSQGGVHGNTRKNMTMQYGKSKQHTGYNQRANMTLNNKF